MHMHRQLYMRKQPWHAPQLPYMFNLLLVQHARHKLLGQLLALARRHALFQN